MNTVKKTFRTVIALILVIALVGTGCVFANIPYTYTNTETLSVESNISNAYNKLHRLGLENCSIISANVSFDNVGNRAEVVDLSNDDVLIWVYDNYDGLVSTSYFDRASCKLYQYYESSNAGIVVKSIKGNADCLEEESTNNNGLRYIIPAGAVTGARVSCTGNTHGSKTMDIFGEKNLITGAYYTENQLFHDFAEFVSELCLILSSPGFIISPFATLLLNGAGFAVTALDFIIYVKVRCNKDYVTWDVFDTATTQTTSFTGMKYYCEEYQGIDYSHDDGTGNYYDISSLRQYSNSLAKKCYNKIYGSDTVTVNSWSNIW